jgi:hypothetical protein
LPDYVVVDFPHLSLPPHIDPWDREHPTVWYCNRLHYPIIYFLLCDYIFLFHLPRLACTDSN